MTNDIKNEVNNINNYETYSAEPYTESLIVQTTPEIDDIIYNNAVKKAKDINEGKEKYNILTNNCSQMVIDCIQKDTNIDIKDGFTPKPNEKFENIKKSLKNE